MNLRNSPFIHQDYKKTGSIETWHVPKIRKTLDKQGFFISYPIEPSISNLIKRFISTAYSIGSSFVNGSMKPITIISVASCSEIPRLIKRTIAPLTLLKLSLRAQEKYCHSRFRCMELCLM